MVASVVYRYSCARSRSQPRNWVAAGFRFGVVISMRLRLQDINEALDAMLTGTEGRVVVTFD